MLVKREGIKGEGGGSRGSKEKDLRERSLRRLSHEGLVARIDVHGDFHGNLASHGVVGLTKTLIGLVNSS